MTRSTRQTLAIASALALAHAVTACAVEPTAPAVQVAAFNEAPAEPDGAARRVHTARQFAHGAGGDPKALAQVIQLTRGMEAAAAASAFDELAAAHERARNLTLAADVRRTLVDQFSREPIAAQSVLWLARLYASSEIGFASRQADPGKQALAQQMASTNPEAVATAKDRGASTSVAIAAYGLHLANEAARANPALDDDPALRIQRYVAARRVGDVKVANKFLAPLNRAGAAEPWGACARAETWLASPADGPAPKPTLPCPAAAAPPQLDGRLDEPLWHGEAMARLRDNPREAPTQAASGDVRVAYDEEFLYLAVCCAKVPGVRYDADPRPRVHDADVSQSDRVRLLVDLDRDYATWFELTIDSRGCTVDRCGEDAAWNPEWYVAAGVGEFRSSEPDAHGDCWTIEAAIPFSSLTDDPPAPGAAWACAIERLTPAAAPQRWCGQPAGAATPENFGLLLFQ